MRFLSELLPLIEPYCSGWKAIATFVRYQTTCWLLTKLRWMCLLFIGHRLIFILNDRKKLKQFGHKIRKGRLVNVVTTSLNNTTGQMSELSWRNKAGVCYSSSRNYYQQCHGTVSWHGVLETVWLHCDEAQQVGCLRELEGCPLV